ncbi:Mevalonate kinase [Formica fusca]
MIEFKISAPGRIILSGDHSMIYGRKVVAAGLDLRTKIEFCETVTTDEIIRVYLPNVDMSVEISVELIQKFASSALFKDKLINYHVPLLKQIEYFICLKRYVGKWNDRVLI